jgi:hypothetical protein
VKLADLNDDTFLDLILVISGLDAVSIQLGTGSGFQPPLPNSIVGPGPISAVVDDVTGDAQPDLIVIHLFANDIFVLPGNGDGTLQAPEVFAASVGVEVSSVAIAIADFNNDAQLDIATTHDGAAIATILLHQ